MAPGKTLLVTAAAALLGGTGTLLRWAAARRRRGACATEVVSGPAASLDTASMGPDAISIVSWNILVGCLLGDCRGRRAGGQSGQRVCAVEELGAATAGRARRADGCRALGPVRVQRALSPTASPTPPVPFCPKSPMQKGRPLRLGPHILPA
jgi:hypothetical protein